MRFIATGTVEPLVRKILQYAAPTAGQFHSFSSTRVYELYRACSCASFSQYVAPAYSTSMNERQTATPKGTASSDGFDTIADAAGRAFRYIPPNNAIIIRSRDESACSVGYVCTPGNRTPSIQVLYWGHTRIDTLDAIYVRGSSTKGKRLPVIVGTTIQTRAAIDKEVAHCGKKCF